MMGEEREILVAGNTTNPKVLVVCDVPSEETHSAGKTMPLPSTRLFQEEALANEFSKDDFAFITCSPPIPEEHSHTESKVNTFLESKRGKFLSRLKPLAEKADLIIYFGKYAGRQLTGRSVKITQERGKVAELDIPNIDHPKAILPLYAPAHILRRPENLEIFQTDFMLAAGFRDAGYSYEEYASSMMNGRYRWCLDLSKEMDLDNPPKALALDCETIGLRWYLGVRVLVVQLSWKKGEAVLLPIDTKYFNDDNLRGDSSRHLPKMDAVKRRNLLGQLRRLLSNPEVAVMGHNLKFDLHALKTLNIEVANWAHDTMQLAFVCDDNMQSKGLDDCVRRWVPSMAGYADCVVPETEVLTSDMRKVRADSLVVGDRLCAFDEHSGGVKGGRRKMRVAKVTGTQQLTRPCVKITTSEGKTLTMSEGHLLLTKGHKGNAGGGWRWRKASALSKGMLVKPFSWSDPEDTKDAGYIAGLLDGEGWVCSGRARIGFSQKQDSVLRKYEDVVRGGSKSIDRRTGVANIVHDGHECFHLLQKYRPIRLTSSEAWEGCGLPTNGQVSETIISVEDAGDQTVIGLETDTQTLISNGILSHNSFNKATDKSRMEAVPHDAMVWYGGGDADVARRLCFTLVKLAKKDARNYNCYTRIQMPSLRAFFKMEREGIRVDQPALERLGIVATTQEEQLKRELLEQVSPKMKRKHLDNPKMKNKKPEDILSFSRAEFITDILFSPKSEGGMGLRPRVFTDSTKRLPPEERVPSASSKSHLPFFDHIPFVVQLIDYLKLAKMRSTYIGDDSHDEYRQVNLLKSGKRYMKAAQDIIDEHGLQVNYLPAIDGEPDEFHQVTLVKEGIVIGTDSEGRPWFKEIIDPTGFWKYISGEGNIHPSFMLHRTVTGRSASADPNGQNIPKRGTTPRIAELVTAYRKVFKAKEGHKLIEADLSQAELRLVAWMAMEDTMIDIYNKNGDIHASTAARTMGITMEEFYQLTPKEQKKGRSSAKGVNFGYIYGMWWTTFRSFAKTDYGIDLTESQAEQARVDFFELYDRLEDWHIAMKKFARAHGYVRSLHGALRRLPAIYSSDEGVQKDAERQAINSTIQRFGSDLGLMAMTTFAENCPWEVMRPIGFIHDAVIIEVLEGHEQEAMESIKWIMNNPPLREWFDIESPVPLLSDVSIGDSLGDMEELDDIEPVKPDWLD